MKKLQRTHFIFGLLCFLFFLGTGQYMRHYALVVTLENAPRALYRAGHIYILFSGFLHLLLGLYIQKARPGWRCIIQILASSLLFVASLILAYSFAIEYPTSSVERPIGRMGIYISLAGMIGHIIANFPKYSREAV